MEFGHLKIPFGFRGAGWKDSNHGYHAYRIMATNSMVDIFNEE